MALLWVWTTLRQIPISKRFGAALTVFFLLLAFYNAWRQQKHEAEAARASLEERYRPKLDCRFEQWFLSEMKDHPNRTLVTIQLTLKNSGAPSLVESWGLDIRMPDGKIIHGHGAVFPNSPFFEFGSSAGGYPIKLYRGDSLFIKDANDPIATGAKRAGWVLFEFEVPKDVLNNPDAIMNVNFSDVDGTKHTFNQILRGTSTGNSLYYPGFTLDEPTAQKDKGGK